MSGFVAKDVFSPGWGCYLVRFPARFASALCLVLLILWAIPGISHAQGTSYFNPRDDEYVLLGLKRTKEEFELAKVELDRAKELYAKQLTSSKDLEQAQRRFNEAEVNYQQSLLSIVFENQYVSIKDAVKYSGETGENKVRIILENLSSGSAELRKLVNLSEDLFESLEPDVVNNIYISILNDDGAIISQPYELKIPRLISNKPTEVDFRLLQDLDVITINLLYGNRTANRKIYLRKDDSLDKVEMRSDQFSQEVELGGSAQYGLSLELFSGTNDTFKLEFVNLPEGITAYFVNPDTEARLSYFKFPESSNTQKAALKVFLPDRPNEQIKIDQSIPFYVMAIPRDRVDDMGDLKSRHWTEEDLQASKLGYVRLDLLPKGVGKLLVKAPQLFYSIQSAEAAQVPIDFANDGTRRLDNLQMKVDVPLGWTYDVQPKNIPRLEISAEERSVITITPGEDVAVGRYEVRVRSSSLSDTQPILGEDKTVTVEIQAQANVMGTAIIVLLILLLVGGMVVFGIRLSRR